MTNPKLEVDFSEDGTMNVGVNTLHEAVLLGFTIALEEAEYRKENPMPKAEVKALKARAFELTQAIVTGKAVFSSGRGDWTIQDGTEPNPEASGVLEI